MNIADIDFDLMDSLAEEAAQAKAQIKLYERMEEMLAADYMRQALVDKSYWPTSRQPNQVVLSKVVAKIGNTKEQRQSLENIANDIAEANRKWVESTEKLQTYRDRIAIYQTESANKRHAFT